jgi:hypothetical protein
VIQTGTSAQSAGGTDRLSARRQLVIEIIGIHEKVGTDLFLIVDTACHSAPLSGGIERRQQYRRQNGNNSDDYQQFDQSKTGLSVLFDGRRKHVFTHCIIILFLFTAQSMPVCLFYYTIQNQKKQ